MTAPMAVRLAHGRLHLGWPTGRSYRTACKREISQAEEGPDLVVYWGSDVGKAWRLEVICLDCARRANRALRNYRKTVQA